MIIVTSRMKREFIVNADKETENPDKPAHLRRRTAAFSAQLRTSLILYNI